MSLPVITRAELKALRTRLEFGPTLMAERIGLSHSHYLAIEDGTAPINLLINNAVRWLDQVKGAAASDVCGDCDGRGTVRPDTPGQRQGNVRARIRCEACEGEGVKRALVAA